MSKLGVIWNTPLEEQMESEFLALGKEGLTMNHYDLAEVTSVNDAASWKHFLQNEYVSKYINDEFTAIQDSELRKLIMNISDSTSVGKAQIINSLQKVLDGHAGDKKSGPAFIYTYVPLTEHEQNADNVEVLKHDPFLKTVPTGRSGQTDTV
jgi:hypothetical protein